MKWKENEVLYGRAGYLHLALQLGAWPPSAPPVLASLLAAGEEGQGLWPWHGKAYLGMAHGLAGVLHVLLLLRARLPAPAHLLLRTRLDYCCSLVDPAGRYPSSLPDRRTALTQFCHGAPGLLLLLAAAHLAYPDSNALATATRAAELVWREVGLFSLLW